MGMANQTRQGHASLYGLFVIIAGVILIAAGVVTYLVVSSTLADQHITVADDAARFAGEEVNQPWEAYAQADIIGEHATEIADGQTYAQLPRDDPNRQTVMDAAFLQASLFTSVVAFGVAVMAAGLGLALIFVGLALRSLARRAPVSQPSELEAEI